MKLLEELHGESGGRKGINSELWHACGGPLVSLPQPGSLVYYFPQGHSEQVATSMKKQATAHIPCYPNLSSQLMCQVHKVTLHTDKDTDEVHAQITLQPVNSEHDIFPIPDFGQTSCKQPKEVFCKTLTASDTSTHGGFSVPRRAAEKLFPPLDHSMQPPNQEIIVQDLHDNSWTFRHIYRGQPKRHLLTTGWSVFVSSKRLKAGDSVLFIRDVKSQLLVGVRRANRQQALLPSSVLSADSMHIGVLAAAAHASANHTPFTIYYNPRACPSEFVVPLAKYHRAAHCTRVSIGMRFGMMFEAEDSSKRRYMGTVMGISDIDPLRWPGSKWRNLQVEWDEHVCIERPSRVSLWEIEPPENLFMFSSPISTLKSPYSSNIMDVRRSNPMTASFLQIPDAGDILNPLPYPRILIPAFQVGCPPAYASLIQSITKSEPPLQPITMMDHFNQGNQLLHDILLQTGNQKELTSSFSQPQTSSSQCLLDENSKFSNSGAVSTFDTQVDLPHEVADAPIPKLNPDSGFVELRSHNSRSDQNDTNSLDDNTDTETADASIDVNGKIEAMSAPLLQLPSENLGYDSLLSKKRKCSPTTDPALLLESGFQTKDLKVGSDGELVPHLDALFPDITNPIFPSQHKNSPSQHKSHHLENLGWMLQPSCVEKDRMQAESITSFGKIDIPSLYRTGDSHTASTDISAIANPEHFSSTCTSEMNADQHLLTFAQDSFLEEQTSSFSQQYTPRMMPSEGMAAMPGFSDSYETKGFLGCNGTSGGMSSSLKVQVINGNEVDERCITSKSEDMIDVVWNSSLQEPLKQLYCSFISHQDVQSQVTSNLANFSSEDQPPDGLGGISGSHVDAGGNSQLHNTTKHISPPLRTYTKVQKLGSVGRCIDVNRFRNYEELVSAVACMFALEDQLNDLTSSEWKLVYLDYENDMLLVGDDPWEEFVNCVRCIRILSPSEVQQMSHEAVPLVSNPVETGAYCSEQNGIPGQGFIRCEGNM